MQELLKKFEAKTPEVVFEWKDPETRKASIYGWETKVNKGIAFPHANASEYQLQEGDSFSFQLVLNRRDYHQLMNRRRIKKLDSEVKLKKLINESKRFHFNKCQKNH